eukprot:TRINITY_DN12905_c0_g1_i1.p1 TRINITY_DN12905_c0_g1~~TRINITY_DN12905_c0_g1_i1.p1  ORF type:complete len:277 (+),score=52.65 TRINITY_DN12905_c0_g1_i1:83-832(+)
MSGLQLYIRQGDSTRAVEVSPGATVRELRAAAAVPPTVRLRLGETVLDDPARELADLGACAECVIVAEQGLSIFEWDPDYDVSGCEPRLYRIDGRLAEKVEENSLTYNLCAKPAMSESFRFAVRFDLIPDFEPPYQTRSPQDCKDQRQHDGIGVASEAARSYLCSVGCRLRPSDGQVFVDSRRVGGMQPVEEGDTVEVQVDIPDPQNTRKKVVTFRHRGESFSTDAYETAGPLRPVIQVERLGFRISLL